jgi:hypothetical protein
LKLNDRQSRIDVDESRRASELALTVRSFAFDPRTIGTAGTCDAVREALSFLSDERNWPVYVHCTAGKDRTGYLVGLYERAILGESTTAVLQELRRYGHTGTRAVVFGQIDAELAKTRPECWP